jgi:DNA-binding LytR/AlgR family response regulator
MVIFTTAYPNYALQGYELDVVDYLVKPYPFERFLKAVNKARDLNHLQKGERGNSKAIEQAAGYFFVKADQKLERIVISEICYIEGMENYVVIHTETQKVMTLMTMKAVYERLPESQFIRSHKSYIVNAHKVQAIEGNMLYVKNVRLPISRQNREEVIARLMP